MFPHTITIFNVIDSNDAIHYHRQVINDVFFVTQKMISNEGNGDKYTNAYHTYFSNEALKNYLEFDKYLALEDKSKNYSLRENDIIVYGEYPQINDLSDLQTSYKDYFLIRSISDHRYGSDELQCVEVTN